jgi:GTPase SAR1 family protein
MTKDNSAVMAEEKHVLPKKIKVTAVGDSGVGKTCLLMTYATNKFPEGDVPELYEHMTIKGLYYSFFFFFFFTNNFFILYSIF